MNRRLILNNTPHPEFGKCLTTKNVEEKKVELNGAFVKRELEMLIMGGGFSLNLIQKST